MAHNDLNQCNFIGRLGKDVETRYLPNGEPVASFSIAVGWKSKDKSGAEWVPVVTFSKLAEICGSYLSKGSKVFISGRFKTRKWQDQEGNDRYSTEIVASDMQMLDGKEQGQPQKQASTQAPSGEFEDDIPFNRLQHDYIL